MPDEAARIRTLIEGWAEAVHAGDLDTVVADHADDIVMLRIYEWPTTPVGDELDAEYGAPTSGGPPYRVYEITPSRAFGLPTDGESFAPTRWRFT